MEVREKIVFSVLKISLFFLIFISFGNVCINEIYKYFILRYCLCYNIYYVYLFYFYNGGYDVFF